MVSRRPAGGVTRHNFSSDTVGQDAILSYSFSSFSGVALSSPIKSSIQVVCGADQGQMRKGLWEIPQGLATGAGLLRIQSQMVRVTEHPFEDQSRVIQPGLIQASRAGERFNEPEGADVECSLGAFNPVIHFFHIVAIDQTVGDQTALL